MNGSKTHWLQNPNKNYLGHWDLPDGKDAIVTIESAEWEAVVNPTTNKSEDKRVIRFQEDFKWLKPFICNEINAQTICKVTGKAFMEDSKGKSIKLYSGRTKVKREEVSCIRIRLEKSETLKGFDTISDQDLKRIEAFIEEAGIDKEKVCSAYEISKLADLPVSKLDKLIKQIQTKVNNK